MILFKIGTSRGVLRMLQVKTQKKKNEIFPNSLKADRGKANTRNHTCGQKKPY